MKAPVLDGNGDDVATWDGYRAARRVQALDTIVVLVDGGVAGLDTDGGRWSLICDRHDWCVAFSTIAAARSFMVHPEDWCEPCQARHYHRCAGCGTDTTDLSHHGYCTECAPVHETDN